MDWQKLKNSDAFGYVFMTCNLDIVYIVMKYIKYFKHIHTSRVIINAIIIINIGVY